MAQSNLPTVRDIQRRIAEALEALPSLVRSGKLSEELRPLFHFLSPPPGRSPIVALRSEKKDRKVRETAGAEHWDLSECRAVIRFEESRKSRPSIKSELLKSRPSRDWDFKPVRIVGEPLSTTILNDRR